METKFRGWLAFGAGTVIFVILEHLVYGAIIGSIYRVRTAACTGTQT
jgi:hypothetical protein